MSLKIAIFVLFCVIACVQGQAPSMQLAGNAASSGARPWKPQFAFQGVGQGSNGGKWAYGGNTGVGAKVWESQTGRHSLGAAVNVGQPYGQNRPTFDAGLGYVFRFGRR